jgi:hypothetical protein
MTFPSEREQFPVRLRYRAIRVQTGSVTAACYSRQGHQRKHDVATCRAPVGIRCAHTSLSGLIVYAVALPVLFFFVWPFATAVFHFGEDAI